MGSDIRQLLLVSALIGTIGPAAHGQSNPAGWTQTTWRAQSNRVIELPPDGLHSRVVGIPEKPTLLAAKARRASGGIPTFSRYMTARGKSYKFTMVGSDVFASRARNVSVPMKIIPVRFQFPDGSIFDPTQPGTSCAGDGTPLDLTLQSPVFSNYNYGDGGRQFYEYVRRLEFWPFTGGGRVNPGYSVRVSQSVLPTLPITLPSVYQTVSARCGRVGVIDLLSLEAFLHAQIFPQFARLGITPSSFVLFLFTNVVVVDGGTVDLGYHSIVSTTKGIQTYGVAEYDTSQEDATIRDVSVLSHEIAEWYDDPYVNNLTPPWGHIGQVSDCYPLLEVGDPLSGMPLFEITMPNGVAYHPQETAYFSWFFAQAQSYGSGGYYSSGRTFTSPAQPCE